MRLRTWGGIILVAAAGIGGVYWWSGRPPEVEVAEIARGTAAEIVYATGVVEPESWAKVTPVRRGRIVESCNCEGRFVGKGELLFRLDDTEFRAGVAETRARLTLAEKEMLRASDLYNRGVTTLERFEEAEARVSELRALIAAAESRLIDLEIRAPLPGQVLRIEGEIGEVAELGEALAWVGQPSPLLVISDVNEEDIPRVLVGQEVLLNADAFPGENLPARVASITPMGDPELQTYRVRLSLTEDTPLLIGMTVDVNIIIRTVDGAVLAPAQAISDGVLQVLTADNRIELRPVEIGIRGARNAEILAGAEPGERIVSPAHDGLATGDRVRPRNAGGAR